MGTVGSVVVGKLPSLEQSAQVAAELLQQGKAYAKSLRPSRPTVDFLKRSAYAGFIKVGQFGDRLMEMIKGSKPRPVPEKQAPKHSKTDHPVAPPSQTATVVRPPVPDQNPWDTGSMAMKIDPNAKRARTAFKEDYIPKLIAPSPSDGWVKVKEDNFLEDNDLLGEFFQ